MNHLTGLRIAEQYSRGLITVSCFNKLHVHEDNSPQCPAEQLALIFQGIWINLMLWPIRGLPNNQPLRAKGLVAQLKKTGLYLKIIELFSSHGDSVDKNSACSQ